MRVYRVLGGLVFALLALVGLALLGVKLLVNPNDYKPRIAAAVQKATGRELVLQGDITLSVFPWIALELGPASLGNPPGFEAKRSGFPFASFSHASVRARFLPLLAKRLEIGRVEVDGLDLELLRDADGKGNWSGFDGSGAHAAPAAAAAEGGSAEGGSAEGGSAEGGTGTPLRGIEDIKITHARVSYQGVILSNLNLETGSYADNGVVPVRLHVDFEREPGGQGLPGDGAAGGQAASDARKGSATGERGSIDARFNFTADPAAQHYAVAALNLNGVLTLAAKPRPVRFDVSTPGIDVNLKSQTLTALAFGLNLAGAQVSGSVEATGILDSPVLRGSVKLEPLVVREYLPRLGIGIPHTRDPKAYSLVAAAADFDYEKDTARFEQLQATLDDTHLRGAVALTFGTEVVTFDLAVDTLDADRYLPPGEAPEPRLGPAPAPPEAPGEQSPRLEANGTLALTAMHLAPLDLANVRVTVSTSDRVMRIFPLTAEVDGGQYSGDISLDRRGALPVLSLDEHLSGIDVGKLWAGESGHLRLSGRGNVNLKASGRGEAADAMLKNLNGRFDANVVDGAVEGVDLRYELARADALLGRVGAPAVPNSRRTSFTDFRLSATIANGVAETHDLTISSAALSVTGGGSVNLVAGSVNFALLADTHRTIGDTPLQIPVKVTGPMSDPNVMPDIEALAKGQLKQKLEDVLRDKLNGLFGRP